MTVRLDRNGALAPAFGFSRWPNPQAAQLGQTAWRSHDRLLVVSSRESAYLPGSGEPSLVGPQWLVSVSRYARGRARPSDSDVARVVAAFAMPAVDEDNHHPGIARHLWCPIDERYRNACECKLTEITVTELDGYRWTTDTDGPCRGCEYERLFALPCTLHGAHCTP